MVSRRSFLGGLAAFGAAGAVGALGGASSGCSRAAGEPGVVRLGLIANLSHAPILRAVADGSLARAIAPSRLEVRMFRAGPRVAEALLGRAIDVGVLGPLPIATLQARHPGTIAVISGCASGGASLIVRASVADPATLRGARLATPQIGSTQDVALRTWLRARGLASADRGGVVTIDALAPADAALQLARGGLIGAWLPEPWATRLVTELPTRRLVDERTLWPDGRFPSALVAVRRAFAEARRPEVDALRAAIGSAIDGTLADPDAARPLVNRELERLTTRALPPGLLATAWSFVDFTRAPLAEGVARIAADARALDYLPFVDCAPLFV